MSAKAVPVPKYLSKDQIMQCGALTRVATRQVIDPELAERLTREIICGKKLLMINFKALESWGVPVKQTPQELN